MKIKKLIETFSSKIAGSFPGSKKFRGSENYWIRRYNKGRHSGSGSYGKLAVFKAEIINHFVKDNNIGMVIEYGCGDGNQLQLADYPSYLGFDVSPRAIELCVEAHGKDATKNFKLMDCYDGETADLILSLDVVYHLVEDEVFFSYMERVFNSAKKYVIIYSSNFEDDHSGNTQHVRHRNFTSWVENEKSNWKLLQMIKNRYPYVGNDTEGSLADFYIYEKQRTET